MTTSSLTHSLRTRPTSRLLPRRNDKTGAQIGTVNPSIHVVASRVIRLFEVVLEVRSASSTPREVTSSRIQLPSTMIHRSGGFAVFPAGSASRPVRELKGLGRVNLEAARSSAQLASRW